MAISVLDVRDTFVSPRVAASSPRIEAGAGALRRVPVTALAGGLAGIVEGVGLLATALTGLDGVLSSPLRPAGPLVAAGLIVLAGWIVLCAGSGAALIDGSGRRTVVGVALAETALVGAFSVVAVATPLVGDLPVALPLPAVVLLAVAVPVAKLLLVGTPSARQWVAQGPRVREARPDPVAAHRLLATLTLGVIAAALLAVTVLSPVQDGGSTLEGTVANSVYTP